MAAERARPDHLRERDVVLRGEHLTLRPLTEDDWPYLAPWNGDAEVLRLTEGDEREPYSLEELQAIYRSISQQAYCFLAEDRREAVGDAWLQAMNLPRILDRTPGLDLRRIDLAFARHAWGRGYGREAVTLLLDFAFWSEPADAVLAVDVWDFNERSRRLFTSLGFEPYGSVEQPDAAPGRTRDDFVMPRERWIGG